MKKLTLLILLVTSASCFGQNLLMPGEKEYPAVSSVIGIPFGKTKAESIVLMKAKGYILIPSKEDYLSFKNVKYGNYKAASFTLYFYKNQFFHGLVILIPDQEPKALDEYDELVSTITEKYGASDEVREFKSPFIDGDGYELTAIKGGYTDIKNNWSNLAIGIISTKINKSTLITIDYYNKELARKALSEQKEKNLKDF